MPIKQSKISKVRCTPHNDTWSLGRGKNRDVDPGTFYWICKTNQNPTCSLLNSISCISAWWCCSFLYNERWTQCFTAYEILKLECVLWKMIWLHWLLTPLWHSSWQITLIYTRNYHLDPKNKRYGDHVVTLCLSGVVLDCFQYENDSMYKARSRINVLPSFDVEERSAQSPTQSGPQPHPTALGWTGIPTLNQALSPRVWPH